MFKQCNFNEVQSCNDMMEAVPSLVKWIVVRPKDND